MDRVLGCGTLNEFDWTPAFQDSKLANGCFTESVRQGDLLSLEATCFIYSTFSGGSREAGSPVSALLTRNYLTGSLRVSLRSSYDSCCQ